MKVQNGGVSPSPGVKEHDGGVVYRQAIGGAPLNVAVGATRLYVAGPWAGTPDAAQPGIRVYDTATHELLRILPTEQPVIPVHLTTTGVLLFTHSDASPYILFYLWAAFYAFVDVMTPNAFIAVVGERTGHYYEFIYFSFTTLTTTGYGDIAPVSFHARALANAEQLIGIFYIALLIARLTGLYQSARMTKTDGSRKVKVTLCP